MLLALSSLKEPTIKLTRIVLDLFNSRVTNTSLEEDLFYHPNYPSLLSISDVLSNYGLQNITIECSNDDLLLLPTPFLTRVKGQSDSKSNFTIVDQLDLVKVKYFDLGKDDWVTTSFESFKDRRNSTIATIFDLNTPPSEKNYELRKSSERRNKFTTVLSFLTIPILSICSIVFSISKGGFELLPAFLYTLLSLAGSIISFLLIWYELDEYNPLLKSLCSYGKRVNCSAVLNSKGSRLFGVSWSTIGFSYFIGSVLFILFTGITSNAATTILGWISILASPYTIYSIVYQWKATKQWCLLCITVQIILILQLLISFKFSNSLSYLTDHKDLAQLIFTFLAAYLLPFSVVSMLVPNIRTAKENKQNKAELQRLKHNPDIFYSLLVKQTPVSKDPEGLGITLGNPYAKNRLIKVCNPLCSPCSDAHAPMEALLKNNPDLQIQIIFNSYDTTYDKSSFPAKHLLAIYNRGDANFTKLVLDDWYLNKKDYDAFAIKYPVNGELEIQGERIRAMRSWCDEMEVKFTPTFFLNGYKLPDTYSVRDLKYFFST